MTLFASIYIAVLAIVIPILAYKAMRALDAGLIIPRPLFYAEAVFLQLLLAAGAFVVAARNRIVLFRDTPITPLHLAIGAGVLLFALGLMLVGWKVAGPDSRHRIDAIVPATASERIAWIGVSAVAGIVEEVAYRGVLMVLVVRMLGSWWLAAAICSVIFALAHLLQGWKSAGAIAIFALVFHLMVRLTGGLYVGIVVHFVYDLATGWILGRRAHAQM